jgi:acetyl-CoA carboxylase carboxyltransferase component
MGAEGAAKIVFRREIAAAKDQKAEEQRLVADYKAKFANPWKAAARGYVDDVIEPSRTRPMLISALELLASKRDSNPPRKHGNIPL